MTFGKVHLNSILVQTPPSLHPVTLSPKTEFDQALSIGQFKLYSCYIVMALVGALILGFVMFKLLCRKQTIIPPIMRTQLKLEENQELRLTIA